MQANFVQLHKTENPVSGKQQLGVSGLPDLMELAAKSSLLAFDVTWPSMIQERSILGRAQIIKTFQKSKYEIFPDEVFTGIFRGFALVVGLLNRRGTRLKLVIARSLRANFVRVTLRYTEHFIYMYCSLYSLNDLMD